VLPLQLAITDVIRLKSFEELPGGSSGSSTDRNFRSRLKIDYKNAPCHHDYSHQGQGMGLRMIDVAERERRQALAKCESGITLFDSHLLVPFEDTGPTSRVEALFENVAEIERFLRNSLLYDRIIIPTVDFAVVPILLSWLGGSNFIEALGQRRIQLARYRGSLCYIGGGVGLEMFELRSTLEERASDLRDLAAVEPAESLAFWGRFPAHVDLLDPSWRDIQRAVLDNIVEIGSAEFEQIADLTYNEVLASETLRSKLHMPNTDPRKLPNIRSNDRRWLHERLSNDSVDRLLHLAQLNWECYIADQLGADDQVAGPASRSVVASRLARLTGSEQVEVTFANIVNLTRVPSFERAAENDDVLDKLWSRATKRDFVQFRQWFHTHVRDHPEEAQAEFYAAVEAVGVTDSRSFKRLRFLAFALGAKVINDRVPMLGTALSATASPLLDLFISRFARPYNPKVMIDELKGILGVEAGWTMKDE
jgi:hypothetical protein